MRMVAALVVLVACAARPTVIGDTFGMDAALVLEHGRIFTNTSYPQWTDALAISGGHVIALGDKAAHLTAWRRIDLHGQIVIPGIHDAHVHEPSLFTAYDVEGSDDD